MENRPEQGTKGLNDQLKKYYKYLKNRYGTFLYTRKNKKKLVRADFSIISNNCWGGVISQKYGQPYRSPTCGLMILGHDYIKFCADIKHYFAQKLLFIPIEQSKHYDTYKDKPFPVAMCDDIEIYFMHYTTEEEAAEKWYRRSKRINWDFLFYKISEREAFSEQDMMDFANLPIENKIIIGEKKYTKDTVVIEGIHTLYGDEIPIVERCFNEAEYFNSIAKNL